MSDKGEKVAAYVHSECGQKIWHLGNRIKALEAENNNLLKLLAKERDAFGRKETELWQQIQKLKREKPCTPR